MATSLVGIGIGLCILDIAISFYKSWRVIKVGKFQFAGSVKGRAKTSAERYGSKSTGMTATVGGWDGMIETRVYWNREKECDCFKVYLTPHWQDAGKDVLLAEGILNHKVDDPFVVPAVFA